MARLPFRRRERLFAAAILSLTVLTLMTAGWKVPSRAEPAALTARQRFGFVATSANWRQDYDSTQIGAGWVVDFARPSCATRPGAVDMAVVLYVRSGDTLDENWLGSYVDKHPGAIWLIGSEPDVIHQGNFTPEEYAHLYHDYHTFIKARDIYSQVGPGGIAQPTPLRLEWLDGVLATHKRDYGGELMPVDVWNIHNALLNEQKYGWGVDIPPGIDATEGVLRSPYENDDIEEFKKQIWDFRKWMEASGYADYPLIVSEYGVLMPEVLGFSPTRVNAFMSASFDFFETASDLVLGYSEDGYRLVQRWAWYSLDWPQYGPAAPHGFNGALFDSETGIITEFGLNYAARTTSFPPIYHTDLVLGPVWFSPLFRAVSSGETITRTVYVEVRNNGNQASDAFAVHFEARGPVNTTVDKLVSGLPAHSDSVLTFKLTDLPVGRYSLSVSIDPEDQIVESAECNNQASRLLLVPSHIQVLPLINRVPSME